MLLALSAALLPAAKALAFNGGSRLLGPAPGVSRRVSPLRFASGAFHSCIVRGDGSMRCWGANNKGQLGDGTITTDRLTPVAVIGLIHAAGATAGGAHTCAWLADGTARCWGWNGSGQLGDGTTTDRATPVVVSGLSNVISMAAGDFHTCALLLDGTVRCWGANSLGQLGDGTTTDRHSPRPISGLSGVVALSGGAEHTCALLGDGTARCWGANFTGDLGIGTTTEQHSPQPVLGLTDAIAISAGLGHTCADSQWNYALLGRQRYR